MKQTRFAHTFITGTLFLTFTGVLSRIIGFFYRIFLSRAIGAEGLGIYQLIFPILALATALCAAGVQTSISKFVAEEQGKCEKYAGLRYLYAGLSISLTLSFLICIFLVTNADTLAANTLNEIRCANLIRIMAYSLPFAAIHSCINGYYYGLNKTAVPSLSQLIEQLVRVGAVYIFCGIALEQNVPITPGAAVWGLVLGEIASSLYSVTALGFYGKRKRTANCTGSLSNQKDTGSFSDALKKLGIFCVPLTANRVTINLFSSVETILIPARLQMFGYNNSDALSVFGILTGMAMPIILFPNVLTGSVSVLLLPTISAAKAENNRRLIVKAIKKTVEYCMILGLLGTLFFLLTGNFIGQTVYQNTLAGTFIVTLSWICPFSNLAATLSSILNGLGKASHAFVLHLCGSLMRIAFILFLVPIYGIRAYLYGILCSHLLVAGFSLLAIFYLNKRGEIASSNN